MRFIPKHETVQKCGAILPDTLTNQAMKDSDAYMTYHDFATGKVIPKPKYVRRSTREKTDQAPTASPGKRLKATTNSHGHVQRANEGTGVSPGVPDVPTYGYEDEQISLKSSDEDDDDETESDNDGDVFVHPKFSTHDEEERQDDEDKEEEGSDLRVQTPSHYESTYDETYDEVTQGDNVEEEKLDEEQINEEEEVNEIYNDVNINLEGRDTKMTDALLANVQTTQVIEDTHVIIIAVTPEDQQQSSSVSSGFMSNMLNPNPDIGIDFILNLNTESTSLVDVPVTTNVEMPPSSVITLSPPPIPLIQPLQQTPVPSPKIAPKDDFLEFKQTNLFAEAVSLIPGIVDKYLANQMNEVVKAAVQLQSDRLRSEAQAENEDFINKIDENMKKTIKEQTSHVVAANLSELELKKILIDKIENNKSIDRSVQQKNHYKHYDKDERRRTLTLDRNRGPKERRAGKEHESTSALKEKSSKSTKEGSKSHQILLNEDPRESFNELMDTPLDFLTFVLNWLKVDTLTPELLAGPTLELMKGSCKSLVELEYFLEEVCKATTDPLDKNNPEGQQYPHDLRKPLPLIPNLRGRRVIPFDHFINNDLAYLSGKLTNLNIEERLALGVSLRMFTRSTVIRRRVEDLQLGIESYQKKLNLTKPDTYRSDLK
ncbi:hypothetical protein Tco_0126443 [Tanacetum coccineum]